MRALELYCGIGGFTAATRGTNVEVVAAIDISPHVVQAYNANWNPVARQTDLLSLAPSDFAEIDADLWWMSPPCAPYTRRGNKQDLDDHRAESFLRVLEAIDAVRPPVVALENVEGFSDSRARDVLIETLSDYDTYETVLCPTELGVPNKRPRYYLVASREPLAPCPAPADAALRDWRALVAPPAGPKRFEVPERIIRKYGDGFHVMTEDETYTTCFTGSYGKSWNFTGSYLPLEDGGLRRFTPPEVLAFLGFPESFEFPMEFGLKQRWKYAGNSLSVPAVREILRRVPGTVVTTTAGR